MGGEVTMTIARRRRDVISAYNKSSSTFTSEVLGTGLRHVLAVLH